MNKDKYKPGFRETLRFLMEAKASQYGVKVTWRVYLGMALPFILLIIGIILWRIL